MRRYLLLETSKNSIPGVFRAEKQNWPLLRIPALAAFVLPVQHHFFFSSLLPVLLALFFNPALAQADDVGRGAFIETSVGADTVSVSPVIERATELAVPLTLKAALELALGANPELSAAARELEAVEAMIIQAQARPNPEISALIEDTRRETRSTTLQLNQPIELGGKRGARIDAAERGRDAASVEFSGKRAEIRSMVMAAFFDVLVAQERLQLAQASADLAQRATNAAARRVAAGKVSPVEETKARVAEAEVRLESTLAASDLAVARKRLSAAWGNPTPRFERAEGDPEALPPLPMLTDLNTRLAASPAMRRAKIEVDRRLALVQIERSQRIPDVTISLGARRNEELNLNQAILGVSIPLPLFNRNQGNVLEALRRTDKARDELSIAQIRLANELELAYQRLETVHQEVASLQRDILPGAQSAYDAASQGFEMGKFNFLEVLDAQRTLFQVKSQYLRALGDAHRSAAEIERILGEASPIPMPDLTPDPTSPPAATQP